MFSLFAKKPGTGMPQIQKLNDGLSVSAQISPGDVARIARQGYRTIICNRPDGEAPGQPTANEIYDAAVKAGLSFVYIPIAGGRMSQRDVDNFAKTLASKRGPVLAYCRSGARSRSIAMAAAG